MSICCNGQWGWEVNWRSHGFPYSTPLIPWCDMPKWFRYSTPYPNSMCGYTSLLEARNEIPQCKRLLLTEVHVDLS